MKRILTFFLIAGVVAAEPPAGDLNTMSVPALIEQLAAPKVRLRDEAQASLSQMPEAEPKLRAAMDTTSSEESRLRLKRILKILRDEAWQLRWESGIKPGAQEDAVLRELEVSPDGSTIATACLYGVDLFASDTGAFLRRVGSPCEYANEPGGIRRSLAFSPDGTLIASTDSSCRIFIDRTDGTRMTILPAEVYKRIVNVHTRASPGSPPGKVVRQEQSMAAEPWGIVFMEGGRRIAAYSPAGLAIHDLDGGERKLLPLTEIFAPEGFQTAPRGMAISADRQTIGLGLETMGGKDRAALVSLSDFVVKGNWQLPAIPCSLAVNRNGTEVLVGLREGGIFRCTIGEKPAVPLHRVGGWLSGIDYAPDEKSAVISSSLAESPLRVIALPSGDPIWSAPSAALGFEDAAFAGPDRILATGHDNILRSWVRRLPASANATPH